MRKMLSLETGRLPWVTLDVYEKSRIGDCSNADWAKMAMELPPEVKLPYDVEPFSAAAARATIIRLAT